MSIDFKKIYKGLTIKNADSTAGSSSKELSLTVSSSATTNTSTTIVAAQTANRTITLPDSSGSLIVSSGSLAPDSVVITDATGALSTSPVTSVELESLQGITGVVETRLDDLETNSATTTYVDGHLGGFVFDQTGATANDVVTWDGTKFILDVSSGGGANTALSNLTSTAVNTNLNPDGDVTRDLGAVSFRWNNIRGSNVISTNVDIAGTATFTNLTSTFLSSGIAPGDGLESFIIQTDYSNGMALATPNKTLTSVSKDIRIMSGNTVDGNSGDITLRTGLPSGIGTRGEISLVSNQVNVNSTKIVNLNSPTANTDAANKVYVDTTLGGFTLDQSGAAAAKPILWDGTKYVIASRERAVMDWVGSSPSLAAGDLINITGGADFYNPQSLWDGNTFTADIAGLYEVSLIALASVYTANNANYIILRHFFGLTTDHPFWRPTQTQFVTTATISVVLAIGDTLQFRYNPSAVNNMTLGNTRMSIKKVAEF